LAGEKGRERYVFIRNQRVSGTSAARRDKRLMSIRQQVVFRERVIGKAPGGRR
jgi:hypothetical protein